MATKSGKKQKSNKSNGAPSIRVISENRKARHRFDIIDTLECGVQLTGTEVKSLRDNQLSLEESYARVREGEVWLVNANIPEYSQANVWNHEPKRPRKLLLRRTEIQKFAQKAHENGLTLAPLKVYFNERGIVKVTLGLCKGRKMHDKREALKKADMKRDIDRAMRRGR